MTLSRAHSARVFSQGNGVNSVALDDASMFTPFATIHAPSEYE